MYASTRAVTFFLCSIGLVGALGVASARSGFQQGLGPNDHMKLNCDEQPCDAVARGRVAFNRRNLRDLGGNGRACADCHMPSDGFQLSPAAARARFERLLAARAHNANADDPLFRPVDADDFREHGDQASDYSNLVDNGLVRVTLPLPANVRLIDPVTCATPDPVRCQPTDDTSVDLWRAVMPVLDVAMTGPDNVAPVYPPDAGRVPIMGQDPFGPNRQGGYQHDARFGTLQEQARGALLAHAQVSMEPPARLLDDLAAFQETLFSSKRVEALAETIRTAGGPFPDPDPELDELEQQGKVVFTRACAQCHGGPLHPSTTTSDAALPGIRPLQRYPPIITALPAASHGRLCPVPAAARPQRADLPHYPRRRHLPIRHHLGSGAPPAHGATGRPRDHGRDQPARDQPDRALFPQQLRGDARRRPRSLRGFFRSVARRNPPPNLPPNISSNGRDLDRGFIRADEREALLAYLRKL